MLWIGAYALHNLGAPLARAAKDGNREVEIVGNSRLRQARDLLAHGRGYH
ncbi:phage exclusion protein Lit family protein [Caulobacter segnis]